MSVNYATFTGTVTRNSIHHGVSANGKAWAQFGLAVGSSSYDKETGTYKKEPTFYCDCVAFGKLADTIASVLQEGVSLLVSGHFVNKGYNKSTGEEGTKHELTCDNIAVNCVPWQTISVIVNNSNTTPTNQTTQPTQQPQQQMQMPVQQYPMSGSWNTIPMTAQQQYPISGAAALGVSDDPGF